MTTAEQTEERREVVAEEIQLELEGESLPPEIQEKPASTLPQRVDDWFILLGVDPRVSSVMPSGKADVIPAHGRFVQTKELHLPCALYANCRQPFCALIPQQKLYRNREKYRKSRPG